MQAAVLTDGGLPRPEGGGTLPIDTDRGGIASTAGDIASTTVLTAEFQPFQEVDVMAKVAGYVRTIHVDLGDHVREGQVLAELEVPEMTNEVSKATAMVEQTESEIAAATGRTAAGGIGAPDRAPFVYATAGGCQA